MRRANPTLPVLLFHAVGGADTGIPADLIVSPERFERKIGWLASRGYKSLTVADCIAFATGKLDATRRVLITFDDAYACLCNNALPILDTYGFTGLIFVPTALVGKVSPWDAACGLEGARIMSEREIRAWACRGMEFGSHARTHTKLTTLTASQVEDEVAGSADDLRAISGRPVEAFAYPYGSSSPSVVAAVSRAYQLAFSTTEGLNRPRAERWHMKRTMIYPTDGLIDLAGVMTRGVNYRHRSRVRLGAALAAVGKRYG